MITPETLHQILQVFRHFRDNHAAGMPLHRSYREAVRAVSAAHSITYQTVGDGCRRRLGLNDVSQLYELLAAWIRGDSSGLSRQLKDNADRSAHAAIDHFFTYGNSEPNVGTPTSLRVVLSDETEPLTFRIAVRDARMLKALAELEGVSASELTARIISTAVHDRMKVFARSIIKSAETRGSIQDSKKPSPQPHNQVMHNGRKRKVNANDKVHDVIAELVAMRDANGQSAVHVDISKLRANATNDVAARELQAGRFKNEYSARMTIHDACARRLRPDVKGIREFDELAGQWLRKGSMKLRDILLRHAHDPLQRADVIAFFADS